MSVRYYQRSVEQVDRTLIGLVWIADPRKYTSRALAVSCQSRICRKCGRVEPRIYRVVRRIASHLDVSGRTAVYKAQVLLLNECLIHYVNLLASIQPMPSRLEADASSYLCD